jgi:hypothetical protein
MREEYPNLRAIKKNDPKEFLKILERRTGILVETGEERYKGRPVSVFEFRHLTFQEYLAALALVDCRFPGRDKSKSLAEHIAPLAGQTEEIGGPMTKETVVKENWREVLRLCVACCGDDDVEDALMAILTPMKGGKAKKTARPRAVLATLCLADEPNISDMAAGKILKAFARQNDGRGSVDSAAVELAGSEWGTMLRSALVDEFCIRDSIDRECVGGLVAMMGGVAAPNDDKEFQNWLENLVTMINSDTASTAIEAALILLDVAFKGNARTIPGMIEGLLAMLDKTGPSAHAAAWALSWLSESGIWLPTKKELNMRLINSKCPKMKSVSGTRD